MMQTTCVDEERIQRVDSTYLYLQNKKKNLNEKKNAKKKIAIYTTPLLKNKKKQHVYAFWFPISVSTSRGAVVIEKSDSSLNRF